MPGVSLASVGSALSLDVTASPPLAADYTWLTYAKWAAWDSWVDGNMFLRGTLPAGYIEGLDVFPSGALRVRHRHGLTSSVYTLSLNTWYAIALVRSGDELLVYIREDGEATDALAPVASDDSGLAGVASLHVGEVTFHEDQFACQLMRIWNGVALTQEQIEAEWDSLTPVITSGLYLANAFENDGTAGTRRADSSGNARHWSGTGDADYGDTDLPIVFSSSPGDIVLEAHCDVGFAASADATVERVLSAAATLTVESASSLTVARVLSAGAALGVSAQAEATVERLLTAAALAGVSVDADVTVERLLTASLGAAIEIAATLTVNEPDAPDYAAALTIGFGMTASLTVERVLSADVQLPLAIAAHLLGARETSYQTHSEAVQTMSRCDAVDTGASCESVNTLSRCEA